MKTHPPREMLREMVVGFGLSRCIYAVAELGVADLLGGDPMTCEEIAGPTGSHPDALRRILRVLAGAGLFEEDEEGRFGLTEIGMLLRKSGDDSMRCEILHMLGPSSWASWGEIVHSVRTGEASFKKIFGEDVWTYRSRRADAGEVFDAMAVEMARHQADAVLEKMNLEDVGVVVDVGGGRGEFLAHILNHKRDLNGVLLDSPNVVAGAAPVLEAAGVGDRCRILPGDFFVEVPRGGDLYLFKAVLHNWCDEDARAILKCCRRAMRPGATITLVESALDPAGKGGSFMDIHMLVTHGGRERSPDEFVALLCESGFRIDRIQETEVGLNLIEGAAI